MSPPLRIGVLISGGGSNLQAILDACETGRITGTVVFVGSDTTAAKGLIRAANRAVPTFTVPYGDVIERFRADPAGFEPPEDFDMEAVRRKQSLFDDTVDPLVRDAFLITRAAAEAEMLSRMRATPWDLLVLAGFMRNLSPYFIDRVNLDPRCPRIMNIHPALLPAFPGLDGYGDTFHYGCKVAGCTVHFVDYGEDSGPIIGQAAFAIEDGDTLETVRAKGLRLEWALYPRCIQQYAQGRLQVVETAYRRSDGTVVTRKVVHIGPAAV